MRTALVFGLALVWLTPSLCTAQVSAGDATPRGTPVTPAPSVDVRQMPPMAQVGSSAPMTKEQCDRLREKIARTPSLAEALKNQLAQCLPSEPDVATGPLPNGTRFSPGVSSHEAASKPASGVTSYEPAPRK
jgi:hypothetical protein